MFRFVPIVMWMPAIFVAVGGVASPCERCRALGAMASQEAAIGGDAVGDALFAPLPVDGEHQGSSSFVITGGRWPQPGGLGSPVVLTYSYQNMFDGGLRGPGAVPGPNGMYLPNGPPLPNKLIKESIEEALRLWSRVAPIRFIEVEDDGLSYLQGSTQHGDIRFRHVYINGTDPPPPAEPVAKAQAWFPFAGGKVAGDVEFDHGDPWQESGTIPIPDILGATIHELGHSLGLGHTGFSAANMYWKFTRYAGLGNGALHSDDVAGIQFLYGAGKGRVVPLPTPEPATLALLVLAGMWFCTRSRFR